MLTIFIISNAQQYHFDYMLTTENKLLDQGKNRIRLISSVLTSAKNKTYDLKISWIGTAILFDHDRDVRHNFSVSTDPQNGSYHFTYINTESNAIMRAHIKKIFRIQKISENEYSLEGFNRKTSKKPYIVFTVKVKEAAANLLFLQGHMYPIELRNLSSLLESTLDKEKKYVVESSKVDYIKYHKELFTYKSLEKIDITLNVEEKIKK